jgi:hypothetical protein
MEGQPTKAEYTQKALNRLERPPMKNLWPRLSKGPYVTSLANGPN